VPGALERWAKLNIAESPYNNIDTLFICTQPVHCASLWRQGTKSLLSTMKKRRKMIQDEVNIDVRTALAVFEKISRLGAKSEEGWIFDQMTANSGFDGYTVTLSDQHATLTVNFHNTFHIDCDSRKDLQSFVEHLERIRNLPEDK